jgi:hypothetical protein
MSIPKCMLHADCIYPDAQNVGRTISDWNLTVNGVCPRCCAVFCSRGCLEGHVTGYHPLLERTVAAENVCRQVPRALGTLGEEDIGPLHGS